MFMIAEPSVPYALGDVADEKATIGALLLLE
jgi:hypothetical protein